MCGVRVCMNGVRHVFVSTHSRLSANNRKTNCRLLSGCELCPFECTCLCVCVCDSTMPFANLVNIIASNASFISPNPGCWMMLTVTLSCVCTCVCAYVQSTEHGSQFTLPSTSSTSPHHTTTHCAHTRWRQHQHNKVATTFNIFNLYLCVHWYI